MENRILAQSESIKELATALSKAQGELESAKKDSLNPHFRSKYADLASIWDACRKPLADNGLSVVQFPGQYNNKEMSLTTRLMHSSGEWLEHTMTAPVIKPDPQGIGSCLTYLRRYSLAAVTGVYQDDDDGNAASQERPMVSPPVVNQRPAMPIEPKIEATVARITEVLPVHDFAPNEDDDFPLSQPVSDPIANYIIPFGKNKGKTMGSVDPREVSTSLWAAREGIATNQPWISKVGGAEVVEKFIKAASSYLRDTME